MNAASRMKGLVRGGLQSCFGLERYLYWYARWSLRDAYQATRQKDMQAFLARIPEDGVALDIGAGIGTTTVPMARRVRRGTVHSFEPHPLSRRVLERVLAREGIGNARVHGVAAGAAAGRARLVMPTSAGARLFGLTHVLHDSIETFNDGDEVEVEQVTIDDHLDLPGGERVTGIKLDVENYERFVLQGCRRTLTEHRPLVLCELWNNDNRTAVMELFRGLDYAPWVLDGGRLVPHGEQPGDALDYFFVPREQAEALGPPPTGT